VTLPTTGVGVGVRVGVRVGVGVGVGVKVGIGVGVRDGVAVGRGVGVLVGATVGSWPAEGGAGAFGVGSRGFMAPHHLAALVSKVSLVLFGTLSFALARGVFLHEPSFSLVPAKIFLVTGSHRTHKPLLGCRVKYR